MSKLLGFTKNFFDPKSADLKHSTTNMGSYSKTSLIWVSFFVLPFGIISVNSGKEQNVSVEFLYPLSIFDDRVRSIHFVSMSPTYIATPKTLQNRT